jgi:hypothetical protein
MKGHLRSLLTVCLSTAALLGFSGPSFALGLPDPLHYDMGFFGNWDLTGGISGFGALWNNDIPRTVSASDNWNGDVSIDNAIFILNKTDGQLQFTVWAGVPPQTPVMGWNTPSLGPNLSAFGAAGGTHTPGRNGFGHNDWLFKGYATYQPISWFSVQAGRLPSPDGTEIGVDWFNPTVFISDLNNMQTTTANGGQINFIAGPDKAFYYGFVPGYGSTLTIRLADGYKANNVNELGFTGLWNLNPDGSDNIVAFGHTRLAPAGNLGFAGFVGGFGTVNSDLIGIGGQYVLGNWTFIPQAQFQWLPKDIFAGSAAPKGNYQEASAEITASYQIDKRWSMSGQVQYIATNRCNPTDTNCGTGAAYGNYLALDNAPATAGQNQGVFNAGADMLGFQMGPTWQYHNFFVRPSVAWTHLSAFLHNGCSGTNSGTGYGHVGCDADQFVGLLEVGFLLGQRAD